jgi:iron transport multicopper oxidase
MQLIEAPLEAQQRNAVPQYVYDQCKALHQPFSGNAAGFASATNLKGLPLGPYPQKLGWHQKGIGAMAGYVFSDISTCERNLNQTLRCGVRCVLTAVLGMLSVVWYALGGQISDEEIEHEIREALEAKKKRGRLFGLFRARN